MYIFDTDILSNIVKKRPSQRLLQALQAVPHGRQFTTVITVGEMVYGACKSGRREFFLSRMESVILPNVRALSFDESSARIYGELRALLEKQGRIVSEPDLRIAAIAIQHGFTLVTGNAAHFAHIPKLNIENWL